MLFWCLLIVGIYISGAVITYTLDGWYDFCSGNEEDLMPMTFFWPLLVLLSPLFLADVLRKKLKEVRQKKLEQEAKQEKIRVATEKELEKIEAELAAEFPQKDQEKSATI